MKRPTETLPDPWLFDSEALLRELDRCSETVLQIPITNPKCHSFRHSTGRKRNLESYRKSSLCPSPSP